MLLSLLWIITEAIFLSGAAQIPYPTESSMPTVAHKHLSFSEAHVITCYLDEPLLFSSTLTYLLRESNLTFGSPGLFNLRFPTPTADKNMLGIWKEFDITFLDLQ